MTIRLRWAVLTIVSACLLTAAASIGFTVRQQHDADKRWCDLMTTIARPESSVSKQLPKVEYERQVRAVRALNKLTADLGCG